MRAVVVYESMYGNTRTVAEAVGEGLRERVEEVLVLPVGRAGNDALAATDLLVVGGPTHAWGLSRPATRAGAASGDVEAGTTLEPVEARTGLREWFEQREAAQPELAAAFDTRRRGPVLLTGHASHAIENRLERWGCAPVADPASFLVDRSERLLPGEQARAHAWGVHIGTAALEFART